MGIASALMSAVLSPAWCVDTAVTADEPIAFVTPARLQLPPVRLRPSPSEANQLADAWLAQLDPGDPRLAAGALDLLLDAPGEVIEAIARKLADSDILSRVLEHARPEVLSRIRNARAMSAAKLLDYAPAEFVKELDAALAAGDPISIASAASTADGFRHLPPDVVRKVAAALNAGKLEDQQRRELVALLLGHAGDLKPVQSQLHDWLASKSNTPAAIQNRDLALTALLSLQVLLPEEDIVAALKSADVGSSRAAIRYMRRVGAATPLPLTLSKEVAQRLFEAKLIGDWTDAYELLRVRNPKFLETVYRGTPPAILAKAWPAELAAEWLNRAPAAVQSSLAVDFPLDLYEPATGQLADCNVLRYKLAQLTVRNRAGQSTLKDFWNTVATRTHNCRSPLGDVVDAYLAEVGNGRGPGPELVALMRQPGLGQLPDTQWRSANLSRYLAPELTRNLLAGNWNVAKQLLRTGVRPSATELEERGFWIDLKPSPSGLDHEWLFRVVQAAGSAPEPVVQLAMRTATNRSVDPVARASALIALAAVGRLAHTQDVFNAALNDENQLVSRTAVLLLGRAYDEGLPKASFKGPDRELLRNTLIRPELAPLASSWLPRLVRFGPMYAQLQAENAKWSEEPSKSCFSMVPARPLGTDIGLSILDAVTTEASADVLRACVGLLSDANSPIALVARQWDTTTVRDPVHVLASLKTLWDTPDFKSAGSALKKRIAALVATTGTALPYDLESQSTLKWWAEALERDQSTLASQLQTERRKRVAVGAFIAVPAALLLHLSVWAVLLAGYPRSPTLQAVVFWNPFVRKVIGFGYIDLVLLYVPFARQRLFAPFASDFLRDVHDSRGPAPESYGYFAGSLVQHWAARSGATLQIDSQVRPVMSALATHRGRIVLLGKSGLGKSSFLKFWLSKRAAEGRDIMVYLRADQCRGGVEAEIVRRMKSVGSDQNLLRSVLYAGHLSVYVDGYNEVDLTTQDAITSFVGDYPHGNILVASQIALRGFTGIETFELLPLGREQVRDFLTTRSEVLPADAVVRDATFQRAANAFLDDVWTQPATHEETRAFEEILANPMDLTSVALLLSQGGVPNLFALEKQQFDAVRRRLTVQGLEFRILGFSRALLTQRLADQEDLGGLPFKPEVTELVHAKLAQVRTFSEPSGKSTAQEIRFRHDRIRDFFSHFSLLEMTPEEQAAHAKDARFAGVFPYLARSMPQANAEVLREQLITLAAHIEDHRVSDSFVREFSWRQRFAAQDPVWMLSHDMPAARTADAEYADLAQKRSNLEAAMGHLRDQIASTRRMTRVLTVADATEMVQLAREMLLAIGANDARIQQSIGATLVDPQGQEFLLVALTQTESIRPFHVDLLIARIERSDMPKLVVLNSQVAMTPEARVADLSAEQRSALLSLGAVPLTSIELYGAFRAAREGRHYSLWFELAQGWATRSPSATYQKEES